ncbi:MAG: phosphoglucosamine mutase [Patescibacteria group bacterium]
MSRELFGTDGVRGLAGQYPLDSEGAEKIGRAVGTKFAEAGQAIIIGGDPRESSAGLIDSLTKGMTAVGVNVTNVGVLPTPGLAYLTREGKEFVAGVMVTASHNTYEYNGVKVFDSSGDKLPDDAEVELNTLIESGAADRGQGQSAKNDFLVRGYEDFLVGSAQGLQLGGMQIAIDAANGAASGVAQRIFERLGAKVTPLSDNPDGRNINDNCGATSTEMLQKTVVDNGLTFGIALDGDADRIMLVDQQGRQLNGDNLLYILAVARKLGGVVATVMSNLGFEQALDKQGIKLERVDVGDRYVLEGLKKTGFKLGGEQSGHIILPELLSTGDGLLAAVQVTRILADSDKSLAQWRDEVAMLPQALVNITLPDRSSLNKPEVQAFIDEQTKRLAGGGRVLIRPSGTEPLARVMVEAPEAEVLAKRIANELKGLVA